MSRSRRAGRLAAHRLYKLGWARLDGATLRHRIYSALSTQEGWWDWGHPLMALTGRDDCGSYDPPRVRDLWYRTLSPGDTYGATDFPAGTQVQLRCGFLTTRDYGVVRRTNDGEWRIFDSQDDGHTIRIAYYPGPGSDGRLHDTGLDGRRELRLFLTWVLWDGLVKAEWLGLRRWAYYKGLNQAVHQRVPFTCQQVPGRSSGGYQHWHCQLRRRHPGDHRFRNMCWSGGGRVYRSLPAEAIT